MRRGRRVLQAGLWALGAAALVAAAGAALGAWLVPRTVRVAAEQAVRDAFGGRARIARVDVNLWRGQVRLLGVEARGLALDGHDVDVAVEEVRLHVGRRGLLGGALQVGAVMLDGPKVEVRAGGAAPGSARRELAAPLPAGQLTVRRGRITYEDAGRGVRVQAAGLEAAIARRRDGVGVSAQIAEGRVAVAGRAMPLGPVAASGVFRPGELRLASLTAEAQGLSLRATGRVGLGGMRPEWDLAVEGMAQTGEIARLAGAGLPMSGQVAFAGTAKGIGSEGTFRASARAATIALARYTAGSVAGRLAIDARRVRLDGVQAALWGGSLRLDGACLWRSGRCEVRAEGRDIDLAQAAAGTGAGGRISGTATFSGVPARPEAQRWTITLRGAAVRAGPLGLGGMALRASVDGEWLQAEASALGETARFRLAGRWRPDLALDVSLEAADVRSFAPSFDLPRLSGALRAAGTLSGPWRDPSFSGKVNWARPQIAALTWESAQGTLTLGSGGLVVDSAAFRMGQTGLRLRGTARPGPGAAAGMPVPVLDFTGEGEGAIEDLARGVGQAVPATGQFTMTVRVRGPARRPEGEARLVFRDLGLGRTRWDQGEARARLAAGALRLEAASLQQGATHLEARGEVAEDGRLALDVTASGLDLAALGGAPGMAGKLSGRARVTGTLADPSVDATVRLSGVAWEGIALQGLRGRVTYARGRTDVGLREEEGRLSLTATLPGAATGTAEISLDAQDIDATPFLVRSGDPLLAAARARVGGTARVTIPLARPAEASGEARLSLAEITLAKETWRAEGPVDVRFTPQVTQVPSAALRGRLGVVRLSGSLRQDGRGEWTIEGPIPLATAALWAPRIEGTGTAMVNLAVAGAAGAAELRGSIQVVADRMRIAGLLWEFEKVACPAVLEARLVTVGPCRAAMSGGTLTASGRLERRSPQQWDHRWDLRLEGAQAAQLAVALGAAGGKITGGAAWTAELAFTEGGGTEAIRTLSGLVRLRFEDGRILQGTLLSRILELLSIAPARRWRLPDLKGAGMAYRELTAVAHLERGVAEVDELRLESDTLRLAGAGSVDLVGRQLQMIFGVRPLVLVDDVVGRLPLVGPALLGKDEGVLTVTYEATGPLEDPTVRLAGARTAARNVLDRLLKLLEGPESKP